ncbi:MAG: hypothetical protein IH859_04395, partial [Chloroflexi bacterium]|nr:hypothetical protein [Chloroflexota bacterium]
SVTITAVTLNATNTNYSGACPVEMNVTGTVSSTGNGALVYSLTPTAETPGFVWDLPGSFTVNYNTAGDHTLDIFFVLTITSSVTGSAFVQVTGGNLLSSNIVNFAITCED